jgi:hypothetical protein
MSVYVYVHMNKIIKCKKKASEITNYNIYIYIVFFFNIYS